MAQEKYYDIHVFYSRKDGFSIPFKIEEEDEINFIDEDEIINLAVRKGHLDSEDAKYVDNVEEIDEETYLAMKP